MTDEALVAPGAGPASRTRTTKSKSRTRKKAPAVGSANRPVPAPVPAPASAAPAAGKPAAMPKPKRKHRAVHKNNGIENRPAGLAGSSVQPRAAVVAGFGIQAMLGPLSFTGEIWNPAIDTWRQFADRQQARFTQVLLRYHEYTSLAHSPLLATAASGTSGSARAN